jgi:hypothetical protein
VRSFPPPRLSGTLIPLRFPRKPRAIRVAVGVPRLRREPRAARDARERRPRPQRTLARGTPPAASQLA